MRKSPIRNILTKYLREPRPPYSRPAKCPRQDNLSLELFLQKNGVNFITALRSMAKRKPAWRNSSAKIPTGKAEAGHHPLQSWFTTSIALTTRFSHPMKKNFSSFQIDHLTAR